MSKAKNRKRAKLLTKRKRERENGLDRMSQLDRDINELKGKGESSDTLVIDREALGLKEKISEKVIEMVFPILQEAQSPEEAQGILAMGIVAWNLGIVKTVSGEKAMRKMLKDKSVRKDAEALQILEQHIQIKCNEYGEYMDFISDYKFSVEKNGNANFTVTTELISDPDELTGL